MAVLKPTDAVIVRPPEFPAAAAPQGLQATVGKSRPMTLPTRARAIRNERLAFCRQVHRLISQGYTTAEAVRATAIRAEQFPLLVRAGKGGGSALTVHNYRQWMRRLGKHRNGRPNWDNADALLDRYYCAAAVRRGRKPGDPAFWTVFMRLYANENRLSAAEAYRVARKMAADAGIAESPTLHQVRYWISHHADQAALMLARYGREWARNNLAATIVRDWDLVAVGEVWFGDHHQFDAPCRVWDAENERWMAARPWLTAWMDAKSGYFAGWIIRAGEHPDSLAIEDALLHGVRRAGNRPPATLYIDNGKDFSSTGFARPVVVDGHEHSVCIELGCRVISAIPYNARAKVIERRFGDVCSSFSRWWPGYLGNRPSNRPKRAGEYWSDPERLPTLQEFTEAFALWLDEAYHARPTNSRISGGGPPAELWESRPELRPALADEELFFSFLKPIGTRVVGRGATVKVANRWYSSEALWKYFSRPVLVKLDRFRPFDRVYCFTIDGRLIAEAEPPAAVPAIARTEADRRLIAEEMKRQRRQVRRARTIAAEYTGVRNVGAPPDRWAIAPAEAKQEIAPPVPAELTAGPEAAVAATKNDAVPVDRATLEEFDRLVTERAAIAAMESPDAETLREFEALMKEVNHEHEEGW